MEEKKETIDVEAKEVNEQNEEEKLSLLEKIKLNGPSYLKKAGIIVLVGTAMAVGYLIMSGDDEEEEDQTAGYLETSPVSENHELGDTVKETMEETQK